MLCSISHWPPVIHHVATNSDKWWRICVLKPIQGLFSLFHLQGKLICLLIKYLFYIRVLFTVSNPKNSNPIWFGGRGKWIQFSHPDNDAVGFSSIGSSFKEGWFPHPRNFFSIRLWTKRQKLNKQTNKTLWISKLKFAHFYNAFQDSSPWLRKGYTISIRSHK